MERLFDHTLSLDDVTVEYSSSPTPKEREIHPYYEILYCTEPHLTLRTESNRIELTAPALVIIPMGCYHFFDFAGKETFHRLKLSFAAELVKALPLRLFSSGVVVLPSITHDARLVIDKICRTMQETETAAQGFFVRAAAMLLLAELNAAEPAPALSYPSNNESIVSVIRYISEHPAADLSISALAKRANVSPSFLTHSFKKEVGISLHRYVLQRRLIFARERIAAGDRPSKIFGECGFSDYSSFYKAYVSFFDEPPSRKRK